MKQTKKSEFLEQELKELLQTMTPGEKLPSVRKLMGRYKVSQLIVDQTLDSLELAGWITRKNRKGVFRYGISEKRKSRMAVFCWDWGSAVYREIEVRLRKLCTDKNIVIEKFVFPMQASTIFQYLPINEFDIILMICPPPLNRHDLLRICNLPIPILFVGRRFENTCLNYVSLIHMENGMLAADYLHKNGCRKTAILYGEPHNTDHDALCLGFKSYYNLNNKEVIILDAETPLDENSCQYTYNFLKKYFAEHSDIEFDSFYLLGDAFYPVVLKVLEENHFNVPEDICVLGSDGNDVGLFSSVPLATVGVTYPEYVGEVFRAICLLLEDRNEIIQIDLGSKVIPRSSVIQRRA
jgi:DNA-binding LacI/PurR family transcriptional regulator